MWNKMERWPESVTKSQEERKWQKQDLHSKRLAENFATLRYKSNSLSYSQRGKKNRPSNIMICVLRTKENNFS